MNKTLLSLTFAGIFAAGLAVAGAASAHIAKSDLGYQNTAQPSLQLVRGGGVDKQDPFEELREQRRQQEQQSRSDGTQNSKTESAGQKETKDDDSEGSFFDRLFDS